MGEPATLGSAADGSPEKLSVCLVEYNPLAAHHLTQILAQDSGLQLSSHEDVFRAPRRAKGLVSVFVLDRGTLPTPLSKFLRFVRFRFREARILVLDQPQPPQELFRLLFLGIQGFLAYPEVDEQLLPAIHAVSAGHLWLTPELLEQYVRFSAGLSRFPGGDTLTRREKRIVQLVQRRMSNKEISSILKITESTVKFHLANVFAKLGVHDRHSVVELVTARPLASPLPQKSK